VWLLVWLAVETATRLAITGWGRRDFTFSFCFSDKARLDQPEFFNPRRKSPSQIKRFISSCKKEKQTPK
jgi:hypothetical protein